MYAVFFSNLEMGVQKQLNIHIIYLKKFVGTNPPSLTAPFTMLILLFEMLNYSFAGKDLVSTSKTFTKPYFRPFCIQ